MFEVYNDEKFGKIFLVKSKRKSIGITFNTQGEVILKSPRNLTQNEIKHLLQTSNNWINRVQKRIFEKLKTFKLHTFELGDEFYYLGKKYPLEFGESILFTGYSFQVIQSDREGIIEQLRLIYRQLAASYIKCHVAFVSKKFNIPYNKIRITSAKSNWGSCSSIGNLNFSWRLIMCDSELVNYVVVHELAHRIELNHSANFWSIVENMLPNYKILRKNLKEMFNTFP